MPECRAGLAEFDNGRNADAGLTFSCILAFSIVLSSHTFRRGLLVFLLACLLTGCQSKNRTQALLASSQLSYAVPYLSYAAEYWTTRYDAPYWAPLHHDNLFSYSAPFFSYAAPLRNYAAPPLRSYAAPYCALFFAPHWVMLHSM